MTQRDPSAFDFANYAEKHRRLILLARRKAQHLSRCSICGRYPVVARRALVHVALKTLAAEDMEGKDKVKAVALCREHAGLTNDQLGDVYWPHWREEY